MPIPGGDRKPVRVLVTGSRTWKDRTAVYAALDDLLREHQNLIVIHGACPTGADQIAQEWVIRAFRTSLLGIATAEPHPADWTAHGKRAGFIRNEHMVSLGAGLALAFIAPCTKPGCQQGKPHGSHGASHCAALAEKAGIEVQRRYEA